MSDTTQSKRHPLIGRAISGRYELLEMIGEGGGGTVFKGEHVTLRQRIAVKILSKAAVQDSDMIRRLVLEARACAMLKHPGLVSVLDLGTESDGTTFIVMEFVDGQTLEQLLSNEHGLPPERVLNLARQITTALSYAHKNGVIHRDIKPSNIIVCPATDGGETIKIVDFGIAKADLSGGEMQRLTQSGQVFGSPPYMSPEQVRGEKVDHRSDIYSLGCVLYEALSEKKAFKGDNMMATMALHLDSQPKPLHVIRPELKSWKELETIVFRCLEKNKEKRFSSMQELEDSLSACAPRQNQVDTRKILRIAGLSLVFLITIGLSVSYLGKFVTSNTVGGDNDGRNALQNASSLLKGSGTDKYTVVLAQAEVVRQTINKDNHVALTQSMHRIYMNAFNDAVQQKAPENIQLALGVFALSSAREHDVRDSVGATKIINALKQPIEKLLSDDKRRGVETMLAAEILYNFGSFKYEQQGGVRKLYSANEWFANALRLAKRIDSADSKALVRRILAKQKLVAG